MDLYQEFIYKSRYSRWLDKENRRETWYETVDRYFDFMVPHLEKNHNFTPSNVLVSELKDAILGLEVMPSMRLLMTAGLAAERDNTCAYNCSYLPVDSVYAFDEAMYVLMCGTGVGFSVERQFVNKLPEVPDNIYKSGHTIIVKDSKAGWAKSLRMLLSSLYAGEEPNIDVSEVRPSGSRLKTFGGRASGPEPLLDLFDFVVRSFYNARGRKLTSVECHDIMCKIGEIVVVGGVRRSAMISLSNLSDDRMRTAKSGQWWNHNPQRALANNSAVYTELPEDEIFLQEWLSLVESKSGERGIFNREASIKQALRNGRRVEADFGTNPCSEIILRPYQFCNLTEAVVRAGDNINSLNEKVRLATILGTWQSSLTKFPYLRKIWKKNTEEERLLGVSLTGIYDNPELLVPHFNNEGYHALELLRDEAIKTNETASQELSINQSAAITCVKPSGTVSQLVDAASGCHPRWSKYYIRAVRGDNKDPLTQFLKDEGVPNEPCVLKPNDTTVFYFPQKAPEGAVTRHDLGAIDHLEDWLTLQEKWCEHKPSVTVQPKSGEWPQVGGWVFEHFDKISGISFLPFSDHSYRQAPYQECTEEEYNKIKAMMPDYIDWSRLSEYEAEDTTNSSQTLSCTANACEIVDISE